LYSSIRSFNLSSQFDSGLILMINICIITKYEYRELLQLSLKTSEYLGYLAILVINFLFHTLE
jgi:hypothetical protein